MKLIWFFALLVGLMVISIVVVGSMTPPETIPESVAADPTPTDDPGPVAVVDGSSAQIGEGGAGIQCFESREKLEAYIDALVKKDDQGAAEAAEGALSFHLGEHVRAIDHGGMLNTEVKLRIESGDDQGASCWVAGDIPGLFTNVRN